MLDHLLTTRKVCIYEATLHQAFREACIQGRLPFVQWLHLHFIVDFSKNITNRLVYSLCDKGHLSTLMWLFNHYTFDLVALEKEKSILLVACTHGNVEMAKYILCQMVALQGVNPHTYVENTVSHDVFQRLCETNSLPMVQWLYSIQYGYLHKNKTRGKDLFISACKNKNNKMAHWLLSVFMNDFDQYSWDELFCGS